MIFGVTEALPDEFSQDIAVSMRRCQGGRSELVFHICRIGAFYSPRLKQKKAISSRLFYFLYAEGHCLLSTGSSNSAR